VISESEAIEAVCLSTVTVYRVHLPIPNAKTRDSNEFGYESHAASIMNIRHSVGADLQVTQNQ
jgi:hypothetical protein